MYKVASESFFVIVLTIAILSLPSLRDYIDAVQIINCHKAIFFFDKLLEKGVSHIAPDYL